jgi:phage terminase Nu1 subunit (DNA packaging protein)
MKGLKCEFTFVTPPRRLAHIVMNTPEKGKRKFKEVVEKVILQKKNN